MTSLPVLNCDGCGQCCRHVGTPPGFSLFFPPPGQTIPRWVRPDYPDRAIVAAMPAHLRNELAAYYRDLWAGEGLDRVEAHMECLWFDAENRRCRNYDHRPTACRDFEIGEEACIKHRERAVNLGLLRPAA